MTFKIKDGVRIGTVDVFNNSGVLQVNAPTASQWLTGRTVTFAGGDVSGSFTIDGSANVSNVALTVSGGSVGSATTSTKWATARTVTFAGGDVTGSFSIDGSADVSNVSLTIAANSVALGTDTTGNYVATIAGTANQVTVTGSGSESAAITLSLPQDIHSSANPTFAGATLDAIQVGITAANEIDTTSGNLIIDSAGGTVTVDDNLIVNGDLTVNGTTTTVNSTITTLDDPILTLGGDTAPSTDDGKDRGVEFRWHNGTTAKIGFFGFDDSSGKFTFIPDATNNSEVFSGTKGVLDATIAWSDVSDKPNFVNSISFGTTGLTPSTGTSGDVTVAGTLAVANGGTGQTTVQAAINALAGATTSGYFLRGNGTNVVMSAIQAGDIPTLNQNTTGTASNVTGTVAIANGGTGATTEAGARTNLGATTVGGNLFTLTNPSAIRFVRLNADNTVSTLSDSDFRTAIGAGVGTVTSIATQDGITGGTITSTGTIGLTGQALALHNLATDGIIARTGSGTVAARTITAGTGISVTNGDGVSGNPVISLSAEVSSSSVTLQAGATNVADLIATTTSISSTSVTTVDEFAYGTYRAAKYLVQITQGSDYQVSEVLLIHNGTTTSITEYGVIETGSSLATVTADISGSNARLRVTMGSATSATVRVFSTRMRV